MHVLGVEGQEGLRAWPLSGLSGFSPGSHRSGLLTGLHAGPHAGRLPPAAAGTLARPALRRLRPTVSLLLPAGDPSPREAGTRNPETTNRSRPWGFSSQGLQGASPGCQGRPDSPLRVSRGSWGHCLLGSLCFPAPASKAWQMGWRVGWRPGCRSCPSPAALPRDAPRPPAASPVLPPPGSLPYPGLPSCRRPAQPRGPAALLRGGPRPGPAHWRQ